MLLLQKFILYLVMKFDSQKIFRFISMLVFLLNYYFNLSLFSILIVTIVNHFTVFERYDLITYLFNLFIKFSPPYL